MATAFVAGQVVRLAAADGTQGLKAGADYRVELVRVVCAPFPVVTYTLREVRRGARPFAVSNGHLVLTAAK